MLKACGKIKTTAAAGGDCKRITHPRLLCGHLRSVINASSVVKTGFVFSNSAIYCIWIDIVSVDSDLELTSYWNSIFSISFFGQYYCRRPGGVATTDGIVLLDGAKSEIVNILFINLPKI